MRIILTTLFLAVSLLASSQTSLEKNPYVKVFKNVDKLGYWDSIATRYSDIDLNKIDPEMGSIDFSNQRMGVVFQWSDVQQHAYRYTMEKLKDEGYVFYESRVTESGVVKTYVKCSIGSILTIRYYNQTLIECNLMWYQKYVRGETLLSGCL